MPGWKLVCVYIYMEGYHHNMVGSLRYQSQPNVICYRRNITFTVYCKHYLMSKI